MSVRGALPSVQQTYIADKAITRYMAVAYNGQGHVTTPSAARVKGIAGIAQNAASASGDVVLVTVQGYSNVIAASSGTVGNPIAVYDTVGRVSTPTAWASGDMTLGWWDEAPTASGDQVIAFINPVYLIS